MRSFLIVTLCVLLTGCGSFLSQSVAPASNHITPTVRDTAVPSTIQTPNQIYSSPATQQPAQLSPTAAELKGTLSEVDVVETLEARVAKTPIIVIGQVSEAGEIINTTRNVNDSSQPDPHMFGLGQVYRVKVEQYLKGTGSTSLSVVQAEGDVVYNPDGPPAIPTTDEEVARLKARFAHVPLSTGTRYLFFLAPMEGFDPALNYRAGALGEPWRFVLPLTGNAQAESAAREAVDAFPPRPSMELLTQVEQLIQTQR